MPLITQALALLALSFMGQGPTPTVEPLKDGFVRVKTDAYAIEIPKAWTVGEQTPWGARSIILKGNEATELGVMTAGVTKQSWDQLYKTSLFFILRQEKGNPTPFKLSKTKSGYEMCSFQVADETGFAKRRFVLLKNEKGEAIALNVSISDPKKATEMIGYFDRMVRTAHVGK